MTTTYTGGNVGLRLGQAYKCGGVKHVNEISIPSFVSRYFSTLCAICFFYLIAINAFLYRPIVATSIYFRHDNELIIQSLYNVT
jgi:hypothetical protein